jgi:hypothetical protein
MYIYYTFNFSLDLTKKDMTQLQQQQQQQQFYNKKKE